MKKNSLVLILITFVITASIIISSISSTIAAKPWKCTAKCNIQAIEGKAPAKFPETTSGSGTSSSEAEACSLAKTDATQKAVAGTYPRHCQCKCTK